MHHRSPDSPHAWAMLLAGLAATACTPSPDATAPRVEVAATLPGHAVIPEGIAHDPVDDVFYVGSTYRRTVSAVDSDGSHRILVPAGSAGLWGVVGMAVDSVRRVLWVASAASTGMPGEGIGAESDGRSSLVAFSLPDGQPRARFDSDGSSFFNDVTVTDQGTIFLTDSETRLVFTGSVESDSLSVALDLSGYGPPNGLVWDSQSERLFVAAGRELYAWSPGDAEPTHLARDTIAMGVIDGIALHNGRIIAVQPFATEAPLVSIAVVAETDGLRQNRVLLAAHPDLSQPTTLAVADDRAYLLANSHLQRFRAMVSAGRLADTTELTAPVILGVPLAR